MTLPAIILTDEQKNIACDLAASGKGNDKISLAIGVAARTFASILHRDPIFAKEIARSREIWVHSMVEGLIGITDGCTTMAEVSAAKVESENIKWVSSKYIPEIYGDNMNININHSLDLSSVLLAAEDRVMPILQAKASTVVDVPVGAETGENTAIVEEIPSELNDLL